VILVRFHGVCIQGFDAQIELCALVVN
jgi:hypothetical protein